MEIWKHQSLGANWLVERRRGILGDEQGMGKTVTALLAARDITPSPVKPLVICPLSKVKDWSDHIVEWLGHKTTIVRSEKDLPDKWEGWLICTFNRAGIDRQFFRQSDLIIIDEAHKLRNRQTELFGAIRSVCGTSKPVFLLTATPIINSRIDIWTLLHLSQPIRFRSFWKFVQYYFKVRQGAFAMEIGGFKRGKSEEWKQLMKEMILSRYKSGSSHSRVSRQKVLHQMSVDQRSAYNGIKDEHALAKITKMLQAAIHPQLIDDDYNGKSKIDTLKGVLASQSGHKTVIFTRYSSVVDMVIKEIPKSVPLKGSMTIKQRMESVDRLFNGSADHLVCTHGVGGEGLNLTAADRAIFLDLAWHPSGNLQALGRIDRPGQESRDLKCIVIHTKDSIEDHVADLVGKKIPVSVDNILKKMQTDSALSGLRT